MSETAASAAELLAPPQLPARPEGELKERLAKIRYVFTDLDGTMLAPGSTVMADSEGDPSAALPQVLVELKQAGVEVIPVSGRNRSMLHEDCRILGLNAYIGEMGGLIVTDVRANRWSYYTAEMHYDPASGLTPHEVIERTGICSRILERWQGLIEYHNDMGPGYKHREVTVTYRGDVPDDQFRAILDESGLALELADNGYVNRISKPTTLSIPDDGTRCRSLHIIPRGLTKGKGVRRCMEIMGIKPEEGLAIGDAPSDFLMGRKVDNFILMENGLPHPGVQKALDHEMRHHPGRTLLSRGKTIDGWVASMRALLAAKE